MGEKPLKKPSLEKSRPRTPVTDLKKAPSRTPVQSDASKKTIGPKKTSEVIEEFQKNDIVRKTVFEPLKKESQSSDVLSGFRLFLKRFSAFFMGVTDFSGKEIQTQFCKETHFILKEALGQLKSVSSFLLSSPMFKQKDLVKSFSGNYPIFTEIILRINGFKMEQVTSKFAPPRNISLQECRVYYLFIIRNFFPFWGRAHLVKASFEQAFKVLKLLKQVPLEELEKQEQQASLAMKRIFDSYFEKLEALYPLLVQKNVEIISPHSRKFLELSSSDFLGSWGMKIQEIVDPDEEEEEEEEEQAIQDENFGANLQDIYNLHLSEGNLANDLISYPKNDKVFIITALLDHCVSEFWILNNSKYVVYRSLQEAGQRFSLGVIIRDFFLNFEKFRVNMKGYSQILSRLASFVEDLGEDEHPDPLYIMAKEEESLRDMRKKLSKQYRIQASGFIESVISAMGSRSESLSKYLQDPDTKLKFQEDITDRRLEGTPLGLLEDFYGFLLACHYLLKNGDLSGMGSVVSKNSPLTQLYISPEKVQDEEKTGNSTKG